MSAKAVSRTRKAVKIRTQFNKYWREMALKMDMTFDLKKAIGYDSVNPSSKLQAKLFGIND